MDHERPAGAAAGATWWKDPVTWVKVLAISILASVLFISLDREGDPTSSVGTLPPFELQLLGGGVVNTADLSGKVTVLNFFATWCGPCKMEMPDLVRFAARQDPARVAFFGVAAGNEHRLDIRPFVEHYHVGYPVALDGEALLGFFGSEALPTTVIIGPDGRIAKVVKGMVNEQWLEAQVGNLLTARAD